MFRRFASELQINDALRGSDSQLYPRPPPKPSKPLPRPPHSSEVLYCELNAAVPTDCNVTKQPLCQKNSFVEQLTAKENGMRSCRNSETSYLILGDNDSLSSVDPLTTQTETGKESSMFVTPVLEMVSSFRPNAFESKLLPPENKPLETAMLKRVKELLMNNDAKTVALHILRMDCKVNEICTPFNMANDPPTQLQMKQPWFRSAALVFCLVQSSEPKMCPSLLKVQDVDRIYCDNFCFCVRISSRVKSCDCIMLVQHG